MEEEEERENLYVRKTTFRVDGWITRLSSEVTFSFFRNIITGTVFGMQIYDKRGVKYDAINIKQQIKVEGNTRKEVPKNMIGYYHNISLCPMQLRR